MTSEKIFPSDTRWGVASKVPEAALRTLVQRLPDWLRGDGSKVVAGSGGFAALLVFGGSADEGEDLAIGLSTETGMPAFLLDFNDEAYSIQQFDGTRYRYKRGHPADFLEKRGILAPGYEPDLSTVVPSVGLVEGVTPAEARRLEPKALAKYLEHPRGVLVTEDPGTMTLNIARSYQKRGYDLSWDPEERRFSCACYEPGRRPVLFSPGHPSPNWEAIDSVLGETTPDGIMKTLDIPRHLLFRDE